MEKSNGGWGGYTDQTLKPRSNGEWNRIKCSGKGGEKRSSSLERKPIVGGPSATSDMSWSLESRGVKGLWGKAGKGGGDEAIEYLCPLKELIVLTKDEKRAWRSGRAEGLGTIPDADGGRLSWSIGGGIVSVNT